MVKYLIKLSRWLLLLLVVIFFAVQVPSTFLTFDNISNVLRVSAFLVILALGQGIVIISGNGGIDLSNGSVAALSSCISALMISGGVNIILAVIVGLLVGAGIGLVNGLLVSVVKLPPFVATYGMDSAVRGAAYILMSGTIVYGVFPDSFRFMGSGTLFGIGVPIYIAAICAVVLIFLMVKTIWGRNVYSIGNNKRAAEISGIGVNRLQLSVFVLNGVIAAFVGPGRRQGQPAQRRGGRHPDLRHQQRPDPGGRVLPLADLRVRRRDRGRHPPGGPHVLPGEEIRQERRLRPVCRPA